MAFLNDAPVPWWRRVLFAVAVTATVFYMVLSAVMGEAAPWHAHERQVTAVFVAWWALMNLIFVRRVRRRMEIRRLTRRIGR